MVFRWATCRKAAGFLHIRRHSRSSLQVPIFHTFWRRGLSYGSPLELIDDLTLYQSLTIEDKTDQIPSSRQGRGKRKRQALQRAIGGR